MIAPWELEALAVKCTVNGAMPLFVLAETDTAGGVSVLFRNHGVVVGSVLKNARSWRATLGTPPVGEGWVKSDSRSEQSQVKPSERGTVPSAQM